MCSPLDANGAVARYIALRERNSSLNEWNVVLDQPRDMVVQALISEMRLALEEIRDNQAKYLSAKAEVMHHEGLIRQAQQMASAFAGAVRAATTIDIDQFDIVYWAMAPEETIEYWEKRHWEAANDR